MQFVYIAAVAITGLVLWFSYRALGNPVVTAEDGAQLVGRVAEELAGITANIDGGLLPADSELIVSLRRRLAGLQQMLQRAEGAPGVSAAEIVRLGQVIESLNWAVRIRGSEGFADNRGLQEACDRLLHSAGAAVAG